MKTFFIVTTISFCYRDRLKISETCKRNARMGDLPYITTLVDFTLLKCNQIYAKQNDKACAGIEVLHKICHLKLILC